MFMESRADTKLAIETFLLSEDIFLDISVFKLFPNSHEDKSLSFPPLATLILILNTGLLLGSEMELSLAYWISVFILFFLSFSETSSLSRKFSISSQEVKGPPLFFK